jgi:hypothetical protein
MVRASRDNARGRRSDLPVPAQWVSDSPLTTASFIPLILLAVILWAWANSRRIHELAVSAARHTCVRQGLQLLDGTVVLHRFAWKRTGSGRIGLQRTFLFAYSENGLERRTGFVIMLGSRVEQVGL